MDTEERIRPDLKLVMSVDEREGEIISVHLALLCIVHFTVSRISITYI